MVNLSNILSAIISRMNGVSALSTLTGKIYTSAGPSQTQTPYCILSVSPISPQLEVFGGPSAPRMDKLTITFGIRDNTLAAVNNTIYQIGVAFNRQMTPFNAFLTNQTCIMIRAKSQRSNLEGSRTIISSGSKMPNSVYVGFIEIEFTIQS